MKSIHIALSAFLLLVGCANQTYQEPGSQPQLIKRAEAGDVEAMYQIFVDIGKKGSPENPQSDKEFELAKYWLVKAGENNSWRAAYVLQLCYEKGCWGLPIDLEKSRHYKFVLEKFGPNTTVKRDVPQAARPLP